MAAVRPSSTTVCLARDAVGSGYKIFMVRRSLTASFMPGAAVFPGGAVDEADRSAFWRTRTRSAATADELAHRVAALRELFEEGGILAGGFDGATQSRVSPLAATWRKRVYETPGQFEALVADEDVPVDVDGGLIPWCRWITPKQERKRFDTMFYLAPLGGRGVLDEARHDEGETIESTWLSPAEALERFEAGEMALVPPTWLTLKQLSFFPDMDELLAHARQRASLGLLDAIEPHMDLERRLLLLPGDREHPFDASPDGENRLVMGQVPFVLSQSAANRRRPTHIAKL